MGSDNIKPNGSQHVAPHRTTLKSRDDQQQRRSLNSNVVPTN